MHAAHVRRFAQWVAATAVSLTPRRSADHAHPSNRYRIHALTRHGNQRAFMLLTATTVAAGGSLACSGMPGSDARPEATSSIDDTASAPQPADSATNTLPGDTSAAAGDSVPADTTARARSDTLAAADTFFEGSEQVWLEARARGVTFRAIGQEPGWLVELGPNETLRILVGYGAREIEMPLPEPVIDSTTWVTSYRARTEEHTARIDIRDEPCADVMSGERFGATVLLVLDGVRYDGCGRSLAEP